MAIKWGCMTNEPNHEKKDRAVALPLYRDETVEDLQRDGLRIIQKKDGFRFSEDAILLAHSVHSLWDTSRRGACSFVEFGSHCGIVSILLSALSSGSKGVGLEISARQVELMNRNIRLNQLEDRLTSVQFDVRKILKSDTALPEALIPGSYHFVVANPPYGLPTDICQKQEADKPLALEKLIARYELALTFKEMAKAAYKLLKPRGRFVFIHKPERLPDIIEALKEANLQPSGMLTVVPFASAAPNLILMSATKDGKAGGFRMERQLVVRDSEGKYEQRVRGMYGNTDKMSPEALFRSLYDGGEAEPIEEADFPNR